MPDLMKPGIFFYPVFLVLLLVQNDKGSYHTRHPSAEGEEECDEDGTATFVKYCQRGEYDG